MAQSEKDIGTKKNKYIPESILLPVFFALVLISLYIMSRYNYLLFHSFIEIFSVVISYSVFIVSTFTYNKGKSAFSVLGVGYLTVGILDFLHTLSYQGMNIFGGTIFYANQLWICARFIEALTVLFFLTHAKQVIKHFSIVVIIYLVVLSAVILTVFYFKDFPVCFISEQGQTRFKIYSEYIICLILGIELLLLKTKNYIDNPKMKKWLSFSIFSTLLSEFCFTLYTDNYGFLNVVGHLLKVVSYYFIYKAILLANVQNPLILIFEELNKKIEETESLNTQLYQSEKKYKTLSGELELIMDNIPGIVFYKDKNNRYIKVNKYFADVHKKTKEEMEGKSLYILYAEEDAENYYKDDLQVIKTGTAKLNIEERLQTETSIRWINVNKIPFYNSNGDILGVIGMAMDITERKRSEEKILQLLKELKKERNEALKSSLTDGLTGIRNRRYINEILQKEIAAAKREKKSLSIAMIDIDYFKDFNDYYGHVYGDKCLKQVAISLQSVVKRETDTLARYGGEEFITIFQNTNKVNAIELAHKMRESVCNLQIKHERSKCSEFVTISIGVTTIQNFCPKDADDLITIADTALYKAKDNGRNRVEYLNPEEYVPPEDTSIPLIE